MWQKLSRFWNKQYPNGTMLDFVQYSLPDISQDYRNVSYLALDLETTGLDPAKDEIISVGMVKIENWRIQLGSAEHMLVKATHSVAQSAVYHGITDGYLADAKPLKDVMPFILQALQNHVLVVHSASVDLAFLNAACQKLCQRRLPVRYVDTIVLGIRRYRLEQRAIPEDALRLHALRELYGLPSYQSHHALSDAIATAELFLAMATSIAGKKAIQVKRLLAKS